MNQFYKHILDPNVKYPYFYTVDCILVLPDTYVNEITIGKNVKDMKDYMDMNGNMDDFRVRDVTVKSTDIDHDISIWFLDDKNINERPYSVFINGVPSICGNCIISGKDLISLTETERYSILNSVRLSRPCTADEYGNKIYHRISLHVDLHDYMFDRTIPKITLGEENG